MAHYGHAWRVDGDGIGTLLRFHKDDARILPINMRPGEVGVVVLR